MLKRKGHYFCSECKINIPNVGKVLLITEEPALGFCSEECIIEFYNPRIDFFEKQDIKLRKKLKLEKEKCLAHRKNKKYLQETIKTPDEIWLEVNEIGEKYYTHIKQFTTEKTRFWSIVVCYYHQGEPSFVFFQNITSSPEIYEHYRFEHEYTGEEPVEKVEASEEMGEEEMKLASEVLDTIELKKSEYLAGLLESRSDSDIAYEKFSDYEDKTVSTLQEPDEIFRKVDKHGDELLTYVKSYQRGRETFFYIVICMKVDPVQESEDDLLVPIVSFPSRDSELYVKYAQGERISGNVKN
ncbi:MAG: hypothetical protein JNM93_11345 [Bacteriovoracaceae bacterium]|nr:hypothetical protein [Bacteriovoracaceae bacterium]